MCGLRVHSQTLITTALLLIPGLLLLRRVYRNVCCCSWFDTVCTHATHPTPLATYNPLEIAAQVTDNSCSTPNRPPARQCDDDIQCTHVLKTNLTHMDTDNRRRPSEQHPCARVGMRVCWTNCWVCTNAPHATPATPNRRRTDGGCVNPAFTWYETSGVAAFEKRKMAFRIAAPAASGLDMHVMWWW